MPEFLGHLKVFNKAWCQPIYGSTQNRKEVCTFAMIRAFPASTNNPAIAIGIMATIFIAAPIIIIPIIFFILPRPGIDMMFALVLISQLLIAWRIYQLQPRRHLTYYRMSCGQMPSLLIVNLELHQDILLRHATEALWLFYHRFNVSSFLCPRFELDSKNKGFTYKRCLNEGSSSCFRV